MSTLLRLVQDSVTPFPHLTSSLQPKKYCGTEMRLARLLLVRCNPFVYPLPHLLKLGIAQSRGYGMAQVLGSSAKPARVPPAAAIPAQPGLQLPASVHTQARGHQPECPDGGRPLDLLYIINTRGQRTLLDPAIT